MTISFEWRGGFDSRELNLLHAESFGHPVQQDDWWARVNRHSLGWVCAREDGDLIGFVNVAWDGATHAFLLDTAVTQKARRRRVGVRLVAVAADAARAAGCAWVHVDFEHQLRGFYLDACGFAATDAGLIALQQAPDGERMWAGTCHGAGP